MMLVEPAFGCAAPAVPELLAQVLAKLYAAFPPGTELPPEVGKHFGMPVIWHMQHPFQWGTVDTPQALLAVWTYDVVQGGHRITWHAGSSCG